MLNDGGDGGDGNNFLSLLYYNACMIIYICNI